MALPPSDWVGQQLAGGRYVVDALLGEGGMGQVYRARDRNIESEVVVKVPRRSMLEQADFAARFTREIRSLVRLSHPQIVKLTDVGEHDGLPFAVMQYLSGGDLEARRPVGAGRRPGPVAPRSLATWLPGVASALDYIHREGYIHRDVKPANILFDAQGHPFLGDFGVAKVLGSVEAAARRGSAITGAGIVLGTPEYMAPELIMGESFDGRVDQYALAVTAYEMLCGRKPFDGDSMTAILVRQTNQEPPPLAELRGPGSEEAARVVLRGLSKQPADRFRSCAEFARALVSVASGMTMPAPAGPPPAGEGRLRCPACLHEIPIPAAVLSAPARARGRRTACPACRTPLRFADEGLALVLEGPADRPAPATVIAMAPEPRDDRPARVARTVPIGTQPEAIPARRAATVRIESMPGLQAPEGRPAGTVLIAQPVASGPDPVAGTVRIESLSTDPARRRPPTSRTIPLAVGAVALVALVAVGSLAWKPSPERALARLEPPSRVAPVAPRSVVPPTRNPGRPPLATAEKDTRAPAIPRVPDPAPPVLPDRVAGSRPPATEEAPPEKPAMATIDRPEPGAPPADLEARPPSGADDTLVSVSLDEVARHPEDYLGRLVIPSELLWIGGDLAYGPGSYQRLSVEKSLHTINKGQRSGSPIEIVAQGDLAANIREMIRLHFNKSVTKYRAIADLRIVKQPGTPGSYLGVVERLEILHHLNPAEVYKKAWGRAFSVALVTPTEARGTHGRGEEWRHRIEGSMLNQAGRDFKAGITQNNGAIFDQAMRAAANLANEANKVRDQQIQLERQRSRGGVNFPTPR